MSVLPLLFGELNKKRTNEAYKKSTVWLGALAVIGMAFIFVLAVIDCNGSRVLEIPEDQSFDEDCDKEFHELEYQVSVSSQRGKKV